MATITVLLPVYNGMPYLPEAIDSILGQTFSDLTLLVINDGSTDGTADYLAQVTDPRLRVIQGEHRGLGAALNLGIAACDTPYLARMDADDIATPNRLQVQWDYLQAHPDVGMVGTQFVFFGDSGREVFSPPMPLDHETIFADLMRNRLSFVHASLLCRTELMKEIGYRVQGIGEDWDMLLRVAETTRMGNVGAKLYRWRLHGASACASALATVQQRNEHACDCAARRQAGQPERSFEAFQQERRERPLLHRASERLDLYALAHYRAAMHGILNDRPVGGYCRLALAAMCSPRRLSQRLGRTFRRKVHVAG